MPITEEEKIERSEKIYEKMKEEDDKGTIWFSASSLYTLTRYRRQDIPEYMEYLINRGMVLKSDDRANHRGKYCLSTTYNEMNIPVEMQKEYPPVEKTDINKEIIVNNCMSPISEADLVKKTPLGKSSINNYVNELIIKEKCLLKYDGQIICSESFLDVDPTVIEELLIKSLASNDDAALKSLIDKVKIALGNPENNILIYGRSYNNWMKQVELYRKLLDCDYQYCAVRVGNKKEEIQVGRIVYSENKDTFYLLYKEKKAIKSISFNSNTSISRTNSPNKEYAKANGTEKEEYDDYISTIFSSEFNNTEPIKCKIKINVNGSNSDYLKRRLAILKDIRDNAQVTEINNEYIYIDTVLGTGDIMSYLRGFGDAFEILDNNQLEIAYKETLNKLKVLYNI